MAERPTGTVTFLFTDVEGSTRLWEAHPVEMQAALERHDEILRSAIESNGGYVFSTAGDAFAAAFARASDAVAAAVAAQRHLRVEPWPEPVPLRVRIGLHTGEAQERDHNYFGPALNRAARAMGVATAGEVLVTDATYHVVVDRLGMGLSLVELGDVELRGVARLVRLYRLVIEGLTARGESVAPAGLAQGNLPGRNVDLVGRAREVAAVGEALGAHRVVTVVGVGGVGKTSLALRAAAVAAGFENGRWLVELAAVSDRAEVVAAVGRVLGVSPSPGCTLIDAVVEWLRHRQVLLVLDNCEHFIEEVAALVEQLVGGAPELRVLATSREPLFVQGEQVVALGSLRVTGEGGGYGPAVELFATRAAEVHPGFDLEEHGVVVTELCARLDGLPLALELAAARMRALSPREVLERLEERFRLLTGGRRSAVDVTIRCGRRSAGPTTCSKRPSSGSSRLFRCSPAGSASRTPLPCARATGSTIGSLTFRSLAEGIHGRLEFDVNPSGAREHLVNALALAEQARNPVAQICARRDLAWSLIDDDPRAAAEAFRDLLLLIIDVGLLHQAAVTCQMVTVVLADAGEDGVAARIIGRVDHLLPYTRAAARRHRRTRADLERRLGLRFDRLLDNGASMTTPQIIDLALESLTQIAGPPKPH